MTDTTHLALPCIEGSQAQKHVTHNEALRILDILVQLAVEDRDLAAPPSTPGEGARFIVEAGAGGAWAGHDGEIAVWQDGAWLFSAPRPGWLAYVLDEGILLAWSGSGWTDAVAAPHSLNDMTLLGVGTTADATNPVSVKLNNALFAARTTAEGGDGNLRCRMNKESAAKTVSLLFQDNWSGRAEIGLTGDDDFHFKVSSDGASWREALVVDRASGKVSFPVSGGPRELLAADRTYYVRPDGSDGNNGLTNNAGGAFLTLQKAIDTIAQMLDIAGRSVIVQVAAGTYTGNVVLKNVVGFGAAGNLVISGDSSNPANVVLGTASGDLFSSVGLNSAWDVTGVKLTSARDAINVSGGSTLRFGAVEFGVCGQMHLRVSDLGQVRCLSSYSVSGSAVEHVRVASGVVRIESVAVTLTGTPAFTNYANVNRGGLLLIGGTSSYSGVATGVRYSVSTNGIIDGGGKPATFLPGNSAGTAATGGVYA